MSSTYIKLIYGNKVVVSCDGVRLFNNRWPASKLRSTRSYWFEFDREGDLVDTDIPESDDGDEALAMAEDCRSFYLNETLPEWLQQQPTVSRWEHLSMWREPKDKL